MFKEELFVYPTNYLSVLKVENTWYLTKKILLLQPKYPF